MTDAPMKLWLISQDVNNRWDTYDSAVVVAADEEAAKRIHPSELENDQPAGEPHGDWAAAEQVKAECIGETTLPAGKVVCASFNAG